MKLPYCRQVDFVKVGRAFLTLDEYYRLIKEHGPHCDVEWELESDCGVAYFTEVVTVGGDGNAG
ncbi:hypothetical protein [Macrococcoides caseolyticum]|uniref:hypothetical protein n=1 Tax=Macrococcoides caseolyticum TaxID=69966 RepID=UPI00105DFC5C|nr:hypothetical protein [Macrococcus caseolyticus]TDM18895.1 hypothetical protein ETI00_02735 [Macrococcus caseolyticus]